MVLFASSFWFSVTTCLDYLIKFITRYLFSGLHVDDDSQKNNSNSSTVVPQEDKRTVSNPFKPEQEPEPEVIDFGVTEYDGFGEKETPRFSFKFQCQPNVDSPRSNAESEAAVSQDGPSMINTSKYQFSPGKDFRGFIEEPEVVSFTVKELFADWSEDSLDGKEILESGFFSEKDFPQCNSDPEPPHDETVNHSYDSEDSDTNIMESVVLTQGQLPEMKQSVSLNGNSSREEEEISNEVQLLAEEEFSGFDSDPELIHYGDRFSVLVDTMDSNSEDFLSEKDFKQETVTGSDEPMEEIQEPENDAMNLRLSVPGAAVQASTLEDSADVLQSLSDQNSETVEQESRGFDEKMKLVEKRTEVLDESEKFYSKVEGKLEDYGRKVAEPEAGKQKYVEPISQNLSSDDSEDSSSLELLWEHQDLIEQLKMELRKVRATGLPTILEESESPRMSEDLKPWNFDEKFLHEDRMDELHKFYKSYRERMRKFDILNYQKMYAIGFLQHKDPLQSISIQKSSAPTLASILSQHIRLHKRRRPEADSVKFIKELQSALETVYVGQMCLSWEFLNWQYGKAKELLESDPYETRQYNQVAGEFQQFQVLMQRFLENEPFQGPRVQHYIKNRCVLRNLLQVPVIKEDPKDKLGVRRRKDAITCSMLLQIIAESMRIFWDFLRADKDEGNVILKGLLSPHIELQDPADSVLLLDAQTILQKKEKKLKDILRSGNCIVKRFQKCHEERSDQLVFFSQVDLKLVSRVLSMSRLTTDQLVWCHKKLCKISFVHRKIHVEPSFLLFPC